MAAPKPVDWVVASAAVLEGAQTIKAATWTDAVTAYASGQAAAGRVVCIPAAQVQHALVETFPTPTVTAE